MARTREAISTIKGYYYQFDYFVLQLLQLENDDAAVCVEGIEDVDILSDDDTKAVQCKYYEGTKCSPSIVGHAVRPMLIHFAENKEAKYSYRLYGYYESGADTVVMPLTVKYAKEKLFTYSEKGIVHKLHMELGLTDDDIEAFIKKLDLKLEADTYDKQIETIIECIQQEFNCTEYDARYFYYNNAVSFVKSIAVKKSREARKVTKKQFLETVGTKRALFDKWYIESIGFEKYYKAAKKQYFSNVNVSSKNRFFLIECDDKASNSQIANLVISISEKWSRLSKRETKPICPYIYLHGLSSSRLASVKKTLLDNDFHIWDGYEYKDAEFSSSSLIRPINYHIGIKAKMINKDSQISEVLDQCTGIKEVYQFYVKKPFYKQNRFNQTDFQIQYTEDVLKII